MDVLDEKSLALFNFNGADCKFRLVSSSISLLEQLAWHVEMLSSNEASFKTNLDVTYSCVFDGNSILQYAADKVLLFSRADSRARMDCVIYDEKSLAMANQQEFINNFGDRQPATVWLFAGKIFGVWILF